MLINRERHLSHENLERQADKIVAGSNHVLQMGNNVTLPVPSVDRGRGDPRNLMCVVTDINTETQQYKLATRYGLLNGSFSRNQFLPCTSNTLLLGSVDFDTEISVRHAAREQSIGTGQGFLKCTCKSGCIKKTCKCLTAWILCNSRCHNSNTCKNK